MTAAAEALEHLAESRSDDRRVAVSRQLAKHVPELDAVDHVLDEDGIEKIPLLTAGLDDVEHPKGELVLAPAMHVEGSLPVSFDRLPAGISAPVVVPFPDAAEEVFDVIIGDGGHIGLVLRNEVLRRVGAELDRTSVGGRGAARARHPRSLTRDGSHAASRAGS